MTPNYEGIETSINTRWENGIDHHIKSVELINHLKYIDSKFNNDAADIECGGDGDVGETLMYLLDVYFDACDKENKA